MRGEVGERLSFVDLDEFYCSLAGPIMSLYLDEKSRLSFISGFSLGVVWLDNVF
jgi:hypothetical protein